MFLLLFFQVIGEEAVEESMRNLTEQAYGNLQHSLVSHPGHVPSPFGLAAIRAGGVSKPTLPWLDSSGATTLPPQQPQQQQQQQQEQLSNSADA